jgi:hypothetical protein
MVRASARRIVPMIATACERGSEGLVKMKCVGVALTGKWKVELALLGAALYRSVGVLVGTSLT